MGLIDTSNWNWIPPRDGNQRILPRIPISSFDYLVDHSVMPIYLVVCGGIAVGKSHLVQRYLNRYWIADVDDYMGKNGFTDYTRDGVQFREAMRQIDEDIQKNKQAQIDMVSTGTGGNYEFLRYRLEEARSHGYETGLIHIRVDDPLQAREQNQERRLRGERALGDHELDLIEVSIRASDESVDRLLKEDRDLLGYFCSHRNQRCA